MLKIKKTSMIKKNQIKKKSTHIIPSQIQHRRYIGAFDDEAGQKVSDELVSASAPRARRQEKSQRGHIDTLQLANVEERFDGRMDLWLEGEQCEQVVGQFLTVPQLHDGRSVVRHRLKRIIALEKNF